MPSFGLLQKYTGYYKELNILHKLTADLLDTFFHFVLENKYYTKINKTSIEISLQNETS